MPQEQSWENKGISHLDRDFTYSHEESIAGYSGISFYEMTGAKRTEQWRGDISQLRNHRSHILAFVRNVQ